MAIYRFGDPNLQKKSDYAFSANDHGDFIMTNTANGRYHVILASNYAKKHYNCFEAIVSQILQEYPSDVSVYFTEEAAQAIANLVHKNQRMV